jgi:hypothetical protein
MLVSRQEPAPRRCTVSYEFIVTIGGIFQMRGGLTQATSFLIARYGSLDGGISAGARILPEWMPLPPELLGNSAPPASVHGSPQH